MERGIIALLFIEEDVSLLSQHLIDTAFSNMRVTKEKPAAGEIRRAMLAHEGDVVAATESATVDHHGEECVDTGLLVSVCVFTQVQLKRERHLLDKLTQTPRARLHKPARW